MKKVYFLCSYFRIDKEVEKRLREEMIKLAESEKHLEFWFMSCHEAFLKKELQYIRELKSVLTRSKIDIVLVEDPIRLERYGESVLVGSGIPEELVSRCEMAPRMEGGSELHENRFIEHHRKVERWVLERCDIVYAYHYDNIPHPTNSEIKRLKKKVKPKVISIYNPEVYDKIEAFKQKMEDRGGFALRSLRNGKNYREIAEELEISINRVQQVANKATRNIMKHIANDYE